MSVGALQMRRRDKRIQTLEAIERGRGDYTAFSSFGGAHQAAARRGFWSCAGQRVTAGAAFVIDDLGQFDLTNNNGAQHAYAGLIPYVGVTGTEYLSYVDDPQFDITGTETTVVSTQRGITLTGWYLASSIAGTPFLMNKFLGAGNNRSYAMFLSGGAPAFQISSTGAAVTDSVTHGTSMVVDTWYFIAARFWPNNSTISIMLDNDISTVAAVSASIFNGAADFRVGVDGGGTAFFSGRFSNLSACASALDNATLRAEFQSKRAQYGK